MGLTWRRVVPSTLDGPERVFHDLPLLLFDPYILETIALSHVFKFPYQDLMYTILRTPFPGTSLSGLSSSSLSL